MPTEHMVGPFVARQAGPVAVAVWWYTPGVNYKSLSVPPRISGKVWVDGYTRVCAPQL